MVIMMGEIEKWGALIWIWYEDDGGCCDGNRYGYDGDGEDSDVDDGVRAVFSC